MLTVVYGLKSEEMEDVAKLYPGTLLLYPEHKLHPHDQAELTIDLLIRSRTEDIKMVTFSDVFVNCIGHFIHHQCVKRDNVRIIVVMSADKWPESKFDQANAYLDENWPFGMLSWGGSSWENEAKRKLACKERLT